MKIRTKKFTLGCRAYPRAFQRQFCLICVWMCVPVHQNKNLYTACTHSPWEITWKCLLSLISNRILKKIRVVTLTSVFIDLYNIISFAPTELNIYKFFKHTPLTYIAQHKIFLHSCNLRVLLQGRVWNGAVLWLFKGHHIPNCHRVPFVLSGRAKTPGHGQHRKSNSLSNLKSICVEIRMKWVITNHIQIPKVISLSILLQIIYSLSFF